MYKEKITVISFVTGSYKNINFKCYKLSSKSVL